MNTTGNKHDLYCIKFNVRQTRTILKLLWAVSRLPWTISKFPWAVTRLSDFDGHLEIAGPFQDPATVRG